MKRIMRMLKIVLPFFLTALCILISYRVYVRWMRSEPNASVGILDNDPESRFLDVSAFTACLEQEGYESTTEPFSSSPDVAARTLTERGCRIIVVSSTEKQDYSALFRLAEEEEVCLLFVGEPPEQTLLDGYNKAWCLRFSPVSGGEQLGLVLKDVFLNLSEAGRYRGETFGHELLYQSLLPTGDVREKAVSEVLTRYGFFPRSIGEEETGEGVPQFILCETLADAYEVLEQEAKEGRIGKTAEGRYRPNEEQPLYLALFGNNREEASALKKAYPDSIIVYRDTEEITDVLAKMTDNLLEERYPTFRTDLPSENDSFFNLEYHCSD